MHLPIGGRLRKRHGALVMLAALALYAGFPAPAKADFVGYYDLSNWTLTNVDYLFGAGTDGSMSTPNGGVSAVLTGGNGGTSYGGETDFVIQAAGSGVVSFNWSYASLDNPGGDFAYYLDNGNYTFLSQTGGESSNGVPVTFAVNAGDTFGFVVSTLDNEGEPGILTITNFSAPLSNAPPVPEPSDLAMLCLSGAGLVTSRWWQSRAKRSQGGAA